MNGRAADAKTVQLPGSSIVWIDAESAISQQLARDEKLLWSGMPRQGVVLRAADAFMIPFSLMWGGFAVFWEVTVLTSGAPPFFVIWGIPFVLVGLYIVFGRFIVDARKRARTYYGLTDQRIMIVSGLMSRKIKSLNLRTLSDVSLSEKTDGVGTITFGPGHGMWSWFGGTSWPGMGAHAAPAFDMIPDAKRVYEAVREAQKAAS